MAYEPDECCRPDAKSDLERCSSCPMRTKPFVAPAQEKPAEAEKSKTTTPPVSTTPPVFPKKIPDWQVLVDDLPTE